jgi:hypothetical protein
MFKPISNLLLISASIFYIGILLSFPFQWHKFAPFSEIFPAFDLIIVYYLSTYTNIKYWHLFIVGIVIDQLYNFPIGVSSLIFIAAFWGLHSLSRWFFLKDYLTNISIFSIYSLFVILSRYLIVTIKSIYYIEGVSILFYFLTTIFSYPIIRILIEKPINIVGKYAR